AARTSGGASCVHPLTTAHRPTTANHLRTPPACHQYHRKPVARGVELRALWIVQHGGGGGRQLLPPMWRVARTGGSAAACAAAAGVGPTAGGAARLGTSDLDAGDQWD